MTTEDERDPTYPTKVGARLRAIRKQKGLSLQDVEASSGQEFKASVLGAYERGERAISVPRLQRLARFYNVPVDQLLPREDVEGQVIDLETEESRARPAEEKVTIDLVRLEQVESPEAELIARYLSMIQVQRGDFNGRVLTIRRDDVRAIAALIEATPEQAPRRLEGLGIRMRH